jgi:hypothetical protein
VAANIHDGSGELVETLTPRLLRQVQGLARVSLAWDTVALQTLGGDYILQLAIQGANQTVLERGETEVQIGQANGRIRQIELVPRDYEPGQDVVVSATLENTGNVSLDGSLVMVVQDASGAVVAEFREAFAGLGAGASFVSQATWTGAELHPRNCQLLAYAEFGGQTTALSVLADWSSAPLAWETRLVSSEEIELSWWSVAGRNYAIEHTPDLGVVPFETVMTGLPAAPPRNSYRAPVTGVRGFYRLREER